MNTKYFDVHVFFTRKSGYSIPVRIETDEDLLIDEEVIEHCVKNQLFEECGDEVHVDTVDEIDIYEYNDMKGI